MQHHRLIRKLVFFGVIIQFFVLPVGIVWAEDSSKGGSSEVKEELRQMRQTLEELKRTIQTQNDVIQKQQAKIDELEKKVNVQKPIEVPKTAVSTVVPARSSAVSGQVGAVLPEIGLVGDIVATSSQKKNDTEGNDRIAAREVELVIGSYVDPYSRFDSTIAFSDFSNVELEEAYLTRWGLPWDLKGRIGRFFPRIGKEASTHRDSLSTVDEPLVIRRFFGEEGFSRAGADFTRPFEGPWGWVLEPSAAILEGGVGEGGATFGSTRRRPTLSSHLKAFRDLSDVSNLELGVTHLIGSKDADPGFEVNVLGVDATYTYYVTPINKFLFQSEMYVQDRKESSSFDVHPWGAYVLADYRFAPRWSVGGRLDQVRLIDTMAPRHEEQGLSAFLTFYQSEFARWRLQYRHEEDANKKHDNAVFFQGTFAIGTHKHQLQ